MKTNSIFATLLVGIAILIYGCKQSSTQLAANQNVWVEITDTTHLPDIWWLNTDYTTWERFTGLAIRDTSEYQVLTTMIDTSDLSFKKRNTVKYPIVLAPPPDFSQYSMVGIRFIYSPYDTLKSTLYVNDGLKQYHYSVVIINPPVGGHYFIAHSQNWIRMPKIKDGYTIVVDTIPQIINNTN